MYTLEQRAAIGQLLRNKIKTPQVPYTELSERIESVLRVKVSAGTIQRVLNGGGVRGEDIHNGFNAWSQDHAISAMALILSVDLSSQRGAYAGDPASYFPDSEAFPKHRRTWICDCFEQGPLHHLINYCKKALRGDTSSTNLHRLRLKKAERALRFLAQKSVEVVVQPDLPLVKSGAVVVPNQPVAQKEKATPTGLSLGPDKQLLASMRAQGYPTGEVEAFIMSKVKAYLGTN